MILAIIVTLDNLQTQGLAVLRAQHPVLVSRQHRGYHLRGRDLGRLRGLGHRPHGLAGGPVPRAPIIGWATVVFGLMLFATGLATNIFLFFLARFGAGSPSPATTASTAHCWPTRIRSVSAGGSMPVWGWGPVRRPL